MTGPTEGRLDVVERAVNQGSDEALSRFRTDLESENKVNASSRVVNPGDVVTAADRAAQRQIVELIGEEYPKDAVVGEEEDELKSIPESGFAWVIDPIDGTYNFARGDAHWATSVALVRDGQPVAAANALPVFDELYITRGDGVTRNGEPTTVSDRPEPRFFSVAPLIIADYGDREVFASAISDIVTKFGNVRWYGSAHVTCAQVAGGTIEGAVAAPKLNHWDSVAGAYLVEQAGGTVTDIHGDPWSHESVGLVVSNGQSHEDVLAIAQRMATAE
jgi:myo-inositol-1(or 4)-monophosphatase